MTPKQIKGEKIWVSYYNQEHELIFLITSKEGNRDYYFLYECVNCELKRLGKARSPLEFEERFKLEERMRASP